MVRPGNYVIEVGLIAPAAAKDLKLLQALTTAAMKGVGADTTPREKKE